MAFTNNEHTVKVNKSTERIIKVNDKNMKKSCIKAKSWENHPKKKWTTQEWNALYVDWRNESKLDAVDSYFFRFDNLSRGRENKFIRLSVFGRKTITEIEQEINWWFYLCLGTYSEIDIE